LRSSIPGTESCHDPVAGQDGGVTPGIVLHALMFAQLNDFKQGHITHLRLVGRIGVVINAVIVYIPADIGFFDACFHIQTFNVGIFNPGCYLLFLF
jgi:hypothetical protein